MMRIEAEQAVIDACEALGLDHAHAMLVLRTAEDPNWRDAVLETLAANREEVGAT